MISNVKQVGILVDVTRCTGCNQCVDACAEVNQLGASYFMMQQSPDGLSARRWSSIVESPQGGFVRKFCRHCLELGDFTRVNCVHRHRRPLFALRLADRPGYIGQRWTRDQGKNAQSTIFTRRSPPTISG